MPRTRRRTAFLPAVLGLALLVSGCADDTAARDESRRGGGGLSIGGGPGGGLVPDATVASPTERRPAPPARSSGEPLTQAELERALLRPQDLVGDWVVGDDGDDDFESVEPARCADVFEALDADTGTADPAAEAEVSLETEDAPQFLGEQVESFADEVPVGAIGTVAAAFAACPTFSLTDADGQTGTVSLSPQPFANLGDQTLAYAMTIQFGNVTVPFDVVYVVIGHNIVSLTYGGFSSSSGVDLEEVARTAVARLGGAG